MLTHCLFPNQGRLGNQLWQVASCFGLAKKYGVGLRLPVWNYAHYFKSDIPQGHVQGIEVKEPSFEFEEAFWDGVDWSKDLAVSGYLQSWKYFQHCQNEVKALFEFDPEFVRQCREPFEEVFEKPVIAIHARRGDYVGNPNYTNLPATYYILALETHFPDWRDCNLLFFSDEIDYLKVHFRCLPNAFFSEDYNDIADICLMSQCDHFILSNSTFAFWAAFLGENEGSKVVRPAHYFEGKLKETCSTKDIYPPHWISFNHVGKKIPLRNTTFTIPVSYDHPDRQENLELILYSLLSQFDTTVIVGEQGGNHFEYVSEFCEYVHFEGMNLFHRTKMLNDMARLAQTPYVVNYDCDVILPPMQILESVWRLSTGADVVYPYGGDFWHVPRAPYLAEVSKDCDVGIFAKVKCRKTENSVGGVIFANREKFFEVGGENENFVSHGEEDKERFDRFKKLGLKVERVEGEIFHLEHWRGINSHSTQHSHGRTNQLEWQKVKRMNAKDISTYVNSWTWKTFL